MKLIPHTAKSLQRGDGPLAVRAYRQAQRVNDDVFWSDSVFSRRLIDLFCHLNAALCRLRNATLIQRQRYHNAAILLYQWEYRTHGLLFSVNGVDKRFSVVYTHGPLHSHRIRRIQLKRQVNDALQLPYHLFQHRWLINLRKTYVHIQHMGTMILLGHALL